MMQRLRDRSAAGRRWATALVATALLTSVFGSAWAQEASDSTQIQIVVRPAGVTPVPAPTPTPVPGAPTPTPGAPGDRPIILAPPADPALPVLGARSAPMPGTVSAQISSVQPHGATDRVDDSVTTLVVRDDRGTASGWDIAFMSVAPGNFWWMPTLMENRDETIRRLEPQDGRPADQVDGVTGGRVVGPFERDPVPVLTAGDGSGSGVYQQQLVVVVPLLEIDTVFGTVFVQLPFAP